jgi:hypothetical protein
MFLSRTQEMEEHGSDWVLNRVPNINKVTALSGSSYVELPKWIKNKKAFKIMIIINV